MNHSSIARRFLGMNSAFSALNGVVLLIAAGMLTPLIIASPDSWVPLALRLLGACLIGFAGLLFIMARNRFVSKAAVNEIVLLDGLWVVGSVALIGFFSDFFTTAGIIVITVVAMVVAFFAIGQFAFATRITRPISIANVSLRDGQLHATVKRSVNASTTAVWDVMTDHPAYANVAGNIARVDVLSGEGLGMQRRCHDPKGNSWEETCDFFELGRSYGFRVHTEAEDYPYPFAELSGRWTVEPRQIGSEFDIEIVARLEGNVLCQWLFTAIARQKFKTILIDLADAWAERMEQEHTRPKTSESFRL